MSYPKIARGDTHRLALPHWAALYEARLNLFGATTTILPMVDPTRASLLATTITTVPAASGSAQTITWSAAPGSLATPMVLTPAQRFLDAGLHGPAGIPGIKLNGTSEYATLPDAAYWTRANAAMTIIGCGIAVADANGKIIFSKWDADDGTKSEYLFGLDASEKLTLWLHDATAGVTSDNTSDAAVPLNTPIHMAAVYDGTGGATAASGITLYINGALVASTATNDGAFVTLRDTAGVPTVGACNATTTKVNFWPHILYVAPYGPTLVQAAATANQLLRDSNMFKLAMGLE